MKNKITIIIAISILAVGGYYIFKEHKKNRTVIFSKDTAIKYIVDQGKVSNPSGLVNLEDDYLKAWASALYYQKDSFNYQGGKYNTSGGKKIK